MQPACSRCRFPVVEHGYVTPLCARCRGTLSSRPLPWWIRATLAGLVVVVAFALAQTPTTLRIAVSYQRGDKAERRGDYATATASYERVVAEYPDAAEPRARLGIAAYYAGRTALARQTFGRLATASLPDSLEKEVAGVQHAMASLSRRER